MTAPAPCVKTEPHAPHFWRLQGEYGTANMSRCPGIDPEQGLAGERDRPDPEVFDIAPEHLHLTDAAALVVRAYQGPDGRPTPAYYGAIAVWQELCGMSEPEALTYAYSVATLPVPAMGTVVPF